MAMKLAVGMDHSDARYRFVIDMATLRPFGA